MQIVPWPLARPIGSLTRPDILAHADNYVVRQVSGRVVDYPIAPDALPSLVQKAVTNLQSLGFVGFQENFNEDVSIVLDRLNLPKIQCSALNISPKATSRIDVDPALYKWDQEL